jgi:murein DD-endopeptidase MepM/ murein hydrolase activator NlpD
MDIKKNLQDFIEKRQRDKQLMPLQPLSESPVQQAQQSTSSLQDDLVSRMSLENNTQQPQDALSQAFNQPSFNFQGQLQEQQGSVIPKGAPVTQAFGAYNPSVEVFSGDGINRGTDFGVKEGTPIALPPGKWEVIDAYAGASGSGFIGNKENSGYGNSVLVRNPKTGETMRFSHLSGVNVQPGQSLSGGTIVGLSGSTGNVTGPHLDLEYKQGGNYVDIMQSPYVNSLFGQGGGGGSIDYSYSRVPMGGGVEEVKNNFKNLFQKIGKSAKRQYELLQRSAEQQAPVYGKSAVEMAASTPQAQQLAKKIPGGEMVRSMLSGNELAQQGMDTLRAGQQVTPEQQKAMQQEQLTQVAGMVGGMSPTGSRMIAPQRSYVKNVSNVLRESKEQMKPFANPDVGYLQKIRDMALEFGDLPENKLKELMKTPDGVQEVIENMLQKNIAKTTAAVSAVRAPGQALKKGTDATGKVARWEFVDDFGGEAIADIKGKRAILSEIWNQERGHDLYKTFIKRIQKEGIEQLEVPNQLPWSKKMLAKLVDDGILENPGAFRVEGGTRWPTRFDIVKNTK